jgi:hypothetical protein
MQQHHQAIVRQNSKALHSSVDLREEAHREGLQNYVSSQNGIIR